MKAFEITYHIVDADTNEEVQQRTQYFIDGDDDTTVDNLATRWGVQAEITKLEEECGKDFVCYFTADELDTQAFLRGELVRIQPTEITTDLELEVAAKA